jgi:uncharacterized membrane protein
MDAVWLTYRYQYHADLFQSIQKSGLRARVVPALLIYVLIPFAVYIWAIRNQSSIQGAIANGALVGAILYGFYDLTNYATFTNWPLEMALTDTLWGTFVCAVGAGIGFSFLARK